MPLIRSTLLGVGTLLLCSLSAVGLFAQSLSEVKRAKVDQAVRAEMEKQNLVGLAVGLIRDGQVAYVQGYGWADREKRIPFTTRTITNWASNSKPVVAVRCLQLVEQGQVRLDDSVRQYLPELPEHCDPITVRHLLCHQSGYPHYRNGTIRKLPVPITSQRGALDPVFSLNRFGGSPLMRDPGTGYSYSSYAYVILSALLERAGRQPLSKQLDENILRPLDMESFTLDGPYEGQKDWSIGYQRNGLGQVARAPEYANDWKHGAGGYKSHIVDFARWAEGMIGGSLVSDESQKAMWTPQKLDSGKPTSCGLGFFVAEENGIPKIYHGGSHAEARSRMVIYPTRKHGIVVLCNCGHAEPARVTTAIYQALR